MKYRRIFGYLITSIFIILAHLLIASETRVKAVGNQDIGKAGKIYQNLKVDLNPYGDYYTDIKEIRIQDIVSNLKDQKGNPVMPEGEFKGYALKESSFWGETVYNNNKGSLIEFEIKKAVRSWSSISYFYSKKYISFDIALIYGNLGANTIGANDTAYVAHVSFASVAPPFKFNFYNPKGEKEVLSTLDLLTESDHQKVYIYDDSLDDDTTLSVTIVPLSENVGGIFSAQTMRNGYTYSIYKGKYDQIEDLPGSADVTDIIWQADESENKKGLPIKLGEKIPLTIAAKKNGKIVDLTCIYVEAEKQLGSIAVDEFYFPLYRMNGNKYCICEELDSSNHYNDYTTWYYIEEELNETGTDKLYMMLEVLKGDIRSGPEYHDEPDVTASVKKIVSGKYSSLNEAANKQDIKSLLLKREGGYPVEFDKTYYFTVFFNDGTVKSHGFRFEKIPDPHRILIKSQPSSVTVEDWELTEFYIMAFGEGLKYLWQYKKDGEEEWVDWTSKTTPSISVAFEKSRNDMLLRCIVTNKYGNREVSSEAKLSYVGYTTQIISQPQGVTVYENETAYFSVEATGKGLTYLWQYKEKGKTDWVDWKTKTTASISVAYASYRDGMSLRCVVSDSFGKKAFSMPATLYYQAQILLLQHPQNMTVYENETASFSVYAIGKNLKYLWQYKYAGDNSWTDWKTKTAASITVAYAAYRNGMSLRCIVTDDKGNKLESKSAILNYIFPLGIIDQPKSTTVSNNELAYFSIKANGAGLKYLWQYKEVGDNSWKDWNTKTTPSISVAYSARRNGMRLRCKVTDENYDVVVSDEAVLSYKNELVITEQPKYVYVEMGATANYSIKANGNGLKYLWQYKPALEDTWIDWTSKTTPSISVAYLSSRNGMSLRCVVTDSTGKSVISEPVILNYKNVPKITLLSQSSSVTVYKGNVAYFDVEAEGEGLTYQWQKMEAGETVWSDWKGKTTTKISVAYLASRNGMKLRCVITDAYNNRKVSNPATLNYRGL